MPLNIQVTYGQGFPAPARQAFARACSTWSQQLDSPVPVWIEACWNIGLPRLVAMCIPNGVLNFPNAVPNTWYTSALADKLCSQDCQPGAPDMLVCFNSVTHTFNTNPAACPINEHDLETNALHELGHGFGMVGLFWVEADGTGCYGSQDIIGLIPQNLILPFPRPQLNNHPSAFGRLVADAGNHLLTDTTHYVNGSQALGDALQSDALRIPNIQGPQGPRAIYSPDPFRPFSSGDHFDDNSLMVPAVPPGTRIHQVDAATLGAMQLMGW